MHDDTHQRRDTIRKLIRSRVIGTQAELGSSLKKEGFRVNQSTLSRDLSALNAQRVRKPGAGLAYEIEASTLAAGPEALGAVHHLVLTIDAGDALVVVKTIPGAASIVAAALDAAKALSLLGTLAGDDTIFIVPARGQRPVRVAEDLRGLWKKGSAS